MAIERESAFSEAVRDDIMWEPHVKRTLDAPCADVVNDRLAPHASAILRAGLDAELIDRVGLQIVNDRVASRAGLVVPLPAPLTVTHCVVSEPKTEQHKHINSKYYIC